MIFTNAHLSALLEVLVNQTGCCAITFLTLLLWCFKREEGYILQTSTFDAQFLQHSRSLGWRLCELSLTLSRVCDHGAHARPVGIGSSGGTGRYPVLKRGFVDSPRCNCGLNYFWPRTWRRLFPFPPTARSLAPSPPIAEESNTAGPAETRITVTLILLIPFNVDRCFID